MFFEFRILRLLTESQGNSTPARKESTKLYRDDIGGMPYIGLKWELEKVNAISENLNLTFASKISAVVRFI